MELTINLDSNALIPLYEQIYQYIKNDIKNGNLTARTKLPSTRALSGYLKVSRSTAQLAYEQLLSEGYIESVPCKGYYVTPMEGLAVTAEDRDNGGGGSFIEQADYNKYQIDFSPRGIALDGFPFNAWRKISKGILVDNNKEMFLTGDPKGEKGLRKVIRSYLHSARGVNCSEDQIIVGAGSEYLLMLLSQLIGKDSMIAMENPTYRQAYRVLDSLGHRVVPVDMDKNGIQIELLKLTGANIAYVMPSHQYPLGIIMPIKRRQELLVWASEEEKRYIIEDDYDSEFRYKGKPIPSLQGTDINDSVIYIGTFSRSIAPAIRISYLVLPYRLLNVYKLKSGFYASTVSRIDQNILCQFIEGGYYERHLNRMRALYKSKHDALLEAIKPLEPYFIINGENAGVHILLTSKFQIPESQLIEAAQKASIKVYGLSSYYITPKPSQNLTTIVLGYANLSVEEIKEGISILTNVWTEEINNTKKN